MRPRIFSIRKTENAKTGGEDKRRRSDEEKDSKIFVCVWIIATGFSIVGNRGEADAWGQTEKEDDNAEDDAE